MIAQAAIKFQELTRYDLSKFINDCSVFLKSGYTQISDFYAGRTSRIKTEVTNEHKRLLLESDYVIMQFGNNSQKLESSEFWHLLEFCENVRSKLQTIDNLSRYLRSSRTDTKFSQGFAHPYTVSDQQTLENISDNVLLDTNEEDDWVDIAQKNDLKETDWDIDGGTNITLYREKFKSNFVTSVIDNMVGEKIYGMDIDRNITFEGDDLKVLGYHETVYQAVDILSNVRRGEIPEFKNLGVNASMFVGSNISAFSYDAIVRQLSTSFNTDDLFINFKITKMEIVQDSFHITFEVNTKYKLLVQSTTVVK